MHNGLKEHVKLTRSHRIHGHLLLYLLIHSQPLIIRLLCTACFALLASIGRSFFRSLSFTLELTGKSCMFLTECVDFIQFKVTVQCSESQRPCHWRFSMMVIFDPWPVIRCWTWFVTIKTHFFLLSRWCCEHAMEGVESAIAPSSHQARLRRPSSLQHPHLCTPLYQVDHASLQGTVWWIYPTLNGARLARNSGAKSMQVQQFVIISSKYQKRLGSSSATFTSRVLYMLR